jgi:hypothetical protein
MAGNPICGQNGTKIQKRTGPETRADALMGKFLSNRWLPVF